MNDIEDALQRLDKLEQGELCTVIAQVANDSSALKDGASPSSNHSAYPDYLLIRVEANRRDDATAGDRQIRPRMFVLPWHDSS